jgi:hypothetical protein
MFKLYKKNYMHLPRGRDVVVKVVAAFFALVGEQCDKTVKVRHERSVKQHLINVARIHECPHEFFQEGRLVRTNKKLRQIYQSRAGEEASATAAPYRPPPPGTLMQYLKTKYLPLLVPFAKQAFTCPLFRPWTKNQTDQIRTRSRH